MNESLLPDNQMDELLIRSLQGRASPEEEARLRAWRRQDPENEREYRRLRELWYLVGAANPVRLHDDVPESVEELVARADVADLPSRVDSAAPARSEKAPKPERKWLGSGVKLALAASLAVLAFGLGTIVDRNSQVGALAESEMMTQPGEAATLSLADGSSVRLGPDSRLRLDEDEDGISAHLDGRAFFDVERDHARSFRVETRRGGVTVLGTRFEVRSENGEFRVVVLEGSVQVTAGGVEANLEEGDVGRSLDGGPLTTERVDDLQELLGWMTGILAFHGTPLREAAREIERRFGVEVVLVREELGDLTVTATFMDESVENVVQVLCELVAAQCTLEGDRIEIGQ